MVAQESPPVIVPPPKRKYNRESTTTKRTPVETKTTAPARMTTTQSTSRRSLAIPNQINENYNTVIDNVENTLQSIDSLVVPTTLMQTPQHHHKPQPPQPTPPTPRTQRSTAAARKRETKKSEAAARPKMIHTEKTRVATDEGSKRRTKTLITRTDVGSSSRASKTSSRRSRTATAPSTSTSFSGSSGGGIMMDADILEELSTKKLDHYSSDLVNDLEQILRSPIKKPPTSSPEVKVKTEPIEQTRTSLRQRRSRAPITSAASTSTADKSPSDSDSASRQMELKSVIKVEREVPQDANDPSNELFQCSMCRAIFSDRSQLLSHVNIHI